MRTIKVLVLIPPKYKGAWVIRETLFSGFINAPRNSYLAASILGHLHCIPKIKVTSIDAQLENIPFLKIKQRVKEINPNIIITLLANYSMNEDRKCAELNYPTIGVLCPTAIDPKEAIRVFNLKTKYFIKDEPENTICKAIIEFQKKNKITNTSGLIIQNNSKIIDTGKSIPPDYTKHIMPAFDDLPIKRYYTQQLKQAGTTITNITLQDGCPYTCKFCSKGLQKYVSMKPAKHIVSELEVLVKTFGCKDFYFMNAEFALDIERAKEICRQIIDRKINIDWSTNNRVNLVDEELISLMKKAGCHRIEYGIESGDPIIQKSMNKYLPYNQIKNAFRLTKKYRIKTLAYLITGFPKENKNSLKKSLRLVKDIRADYVNVGIIIPAPCSQFYYELKANKKLIEENWSEYKLFERPHFEHEKYHSIKDFFEARDWLKNRVNRWVTCQEMFNFQSNIPLVYRIMMYLINFDFIRNTTEKTRVFRNLRTKLRINHNKHLKK